MTLQPDSPAVPPILVVEDDWQMAQTISWVLEDAGFQVEVARDGKAGWEQAQVVQPALVVLDWRLPLLMGDQVAFRLRQKYGDALPILLITADGQVREKAQQIGAAGWLAKPFEIDQFLNVVGQLVSPTA